MKQAVDIRTIDPFPPKRGRPCVDHNHGPLSPAERKRRSRSRGSAREVAFSSKAARRLSRLGVWGGDLSEALSTVLEDL